MAYQGLFDGLGQKAAQPSKWNDLAQFVANGFREYIRQNHRVTGSLVDAIEAIPEFDVLNEVTISVRSKDLIQGEAKTYYFFVDEGVNALPTVDGYDYKRPRVQDAPFSFHSDSVSKGFAEALANTLVIPLSQAYATAYSIKRHGISPRRITVNVMTDAFVDQIGNKAIDIAESELNEVFNDIFIQWQSQ
jgi:hypothetical protein